MCGIFGIVGATAKPLAELASLMERALAHRGPDDVGFHVDGQAMLGNRRLSIIDIAHGHQPVFSQDKQIALVQNGEIYNYVELRDELKARGAVFHTDSDTEVLLRMYEAYGTEFVKRLNGMFAIAIWDARTGEMHLLRDRLGQKPFFVAQYNGFIAFASEIKALLAVGIPTSVRVEAIHHFLSYNYVPPSMTMFEHVTPIMPGAAATIKNGAITHWAWWHPNFTTRERPVADAAQELLHTLHKAVGIHLRSDVEVGAFLSGGVDSSVTVALASEHMPSKMHSFTIGFDDKRFDESVYAEQVAAQLGTKHHTQIVTAEMIDLWPKVLYHCEQPHGDASFMPTYVLSQLAAKRVKVVVTGDGSDELLGGYQRYVPFLEQYKNADHDTFERAYFANQGMLSQEEKLALYTPEWRSKLAKLDSFSLMQKDFAEIRDLDPINRMLWIDLKWLLPGNNLVKPDRMGMAVSLEARVPFLDTNVIDLALGMPGDYKLRDGIPKYIIKEAMKDKLPHSILHRPKQMFTVPIGEWFKTHLAPLLSDILLSERAASRGLFEPSAIRALVSEHTAGHKNHTRVLRALMALEIWQRLFVDGENHATMFASEPLATSA